MRVSIRVLAVLTLLAACATAQAALEPSASDAAKAEAVQAAPSPADEYRAVVDALIANDIVAIATGLREDDEKEFVERWERGRERAAKSEYSSPGDAIMNRYWMMIGTPEGTAELGNEVYPAFAAHANEAVEEFNRDFSKTLAEMASDADLSPDEVRQVSQLMLAVQRWANGIEWQDRARFDRALDVVAGFVRRSGAKTASEIELLPFEEAAAIGDDAIATVKRVLRVYDLDVDGMLLSARVDEIARNGDEATLRWSARVLDVPIELVRDMHYARNDWGNRWMSAKEYEQYQSWQRESSEAEAQVSIEDVPAPAKPAAKAEAQHGSDTGSCSPGAGSDDPSGKQFWSAEE